MYAILDIETTGGQFNEEGITEIAIYKFDGHEIVDQFISLVNPEIPIQPFVIKLTGINNAMLVNAPKFFEVAKRIIEITEGCIIVAHNAVFDYRILRTEFQRLGYDFHAKTICTVELAKKLLPEQPSHSLGKLVRALGIPMADRHRASGDALATVKLFKILLDKDLEKNILSEFIKTEIDKAKPKDKLIPKLLEILENLPTKTGVYYMYNSAGIIIYIGKSKNIKKRINQHFTNTTSKSKKIQTAVCKVTYQETGSELIALLKESEEIKINKPIFNRAQRKTLFEFSLYSEKNEDGYLTLKLQKTDGRKKEITAFTSIQEAKNALFRITTAYNLCQKLTGLYNTKNECFQHKIKECDGACVGKISSEIYNERVNEFIAKNNFDHQNLIIIDKGRNISEKSAILIENGTYKGYAFFDLNHQIHSPEILKNILIPMQNNKDVKNIIRGHLQRSKQLKTIIF